MSRRRTTGTVVTVLIALTAGGCSGDAVPEGFEAAPTEGLTVAYPQGWESIGDAARNDDWAFVARGSDDDGTLGMVSVREDFMRAPDAEQAAGAVLGSVQLMLPGYRVESTEEAPVDGAEDSVVRRFSFTGPGESGFPEGTSYVGADVTVVDGEEQASLVRVVARESEADLVDEIVATVSLEG